MPSTSRFVVQSTIALLAVGLLALLGIVGLTIWLGERARVYFDDVTEAQYTHAAAFELRNALQAAESSQRGFIVTGNEIYLAPYDSAMLEASQQLESLQRQLASYPKTALMLSRLTEVVTEKFSEMDELIALKQGRRDGDALAMFRTNRGKALMDEGNVFLTGIIQAADDRIIAGSNEQRSNAAMLRWVSVVGGLVIVLVVGGATITILRYAQEIERARDEVGVLNASLEARVQRRTSDLAAARDRAEVLLTEVNHRAANSLSLVAALVKLQSSAVRDRAAKDALDETQARILAIGSVHRRLYGSSDVRFVALDEYLSGLLDQLAASMREKGLGASLRHDLEPVRMATDASINLGVVVIEWVTNAFKYAYPDRTGEIRVRLRHVADDRVELTVDDDGVGRTDGHPKGTGVGTQIAKAIAATMGADIEYADRQPGTTARLTCALQSA